MHTMICPHENRGDAPRSPTSALIVSTATSSPRPRWYHLSGADGVFVVVALLVFLTARQGLLDDPGLGWHLRNIDAMLAQRGWLTVDPFTQARDGSPRPWLSNQWLGELPFWLGERWAGLEGVAAVAALVIGFTMRCLYCMLLRDGCPWPVAVFWTSQAAMGISCSWVARPNLFTLLFVMVTSRICITFHECLCRFRTTLWLIPLFAIWANVHGGFLAGFTILVTTLAVEIVLALFSTEFESRASARRRAWRMLLLLGGTFLATLINPYSLSLYRWLFQLLGDPFFMDLHQEWKSPDFHGKGAIRFESLMLLFPLLLSLSKRRPHLVELALSAVWFHFALTGFRYVSLWVVIVVPLLARSSMEIGWLQEQARRFLSAGKGNPFLAKSPDRSSWFASLVVSVLLLGLARGVEGLLACHQPDILPASALDLFLRIHEDWRREHGRQPVVFHSYDWGGYLTWHGGPDFRNWIDDRNEVQGKEHIQDYFSILATEPGWSDKLDRARVQLVCIQSNAPLAFRLAERSKEWRECYRDEWAVIFKRIAAASDKP